MNVKEAEHKEETLDYGLLCQAVKETWPGVPAWVARVDGRKASHYAFASRDPKREGLGVPGKILRGILKSLAPCREVKIKLNGCLEFQYLNEGGMPGRVRFGLFSPDLGHRGNLSGWHKVASLSVRAVTAS